MSRGASHYRGSFPQGSMGDWGQAANNKSHRTPRSGKTGPGVKSPLRSSQVAGGASPLTPEALRHHQISRRKAEAQNVLLCQSRPRCPGAASCLWAHVYSLLGAMNLLLLGFRALPSTAQGLFLVCAQGSCLERHRGPYGVPGTESGRAT